MRIRSKAWAASLLGALGMTAACGHTEGSSDENDATAGQPAAVHPAPSRECLSPSEQPESGIVECQTKNGNVVTHRVAVGTGCDYSPPPTGEGGTSAAAPVGGCDPATCPGKYAFCEQGGNTPAFCAEGCITDADCSAGSACVCRGAGVVGRCVPGDCTVDADCGPDMRCVQTVVNNPCFEGYRFHCESPDDQCTVHDDCGDSSGEACVREADAFVCRNNTGVACGRPFLIDGEARTAMLAPRADWRGDDSLPELGGLSAAERRALADHYGRAAQLEHASIAAFARFSLQLVSLGAPPELIEASAAAMADEARHARTCFAFASHYAGGPLGPAQLALDDCLGASSLEDIVRLVIVEGCVGETVAALEAAEAAEHATDLAVRDALRRIAVDEQRHAELAYRFVAWALTQRGELGDVVAATFARYTAPAAAAPSPAATSLARHGMLSPAEVLEIRQAALRDAVAPCARGLLDGRIPVRPQASSASHASEREVVRGPSTLSV